MHLSGTPFAIRQTIWRPCLLELVNENVQITHDRLITLENRTAMMAKAIIPILKNFKEQINNTNDRLIAQYRMMTRAHKRYNRLFRQTHETFQIHHLALLMFKDYITIPVGTLQRIHSRHGLHMVCHIAKGVPERCVSRLLLTLFMDY